MRKAAGSGVGRGPEEKSETAMENQKTGRDLYHRLLPLLAVLLCVGIWSWSARAADTYSFYMDGGAYVDSIEGDAGTEHGGKLIAEFKRTNLNPGQYTLYIPYVTQQDGSWFEVVDLERGTVLAQGVYPAGQQGTAVSFELKNGQAQMAVRSYQGEGELKITGYNLYSLGPVYTDTLWILALLALLALCFYLCVRRGRAGRPRALQLLLLSCVFSLPYLSGHLQDGHDMPFHVSRITGLGMALRGGQIPAHLCFDFYNSAGGCISSAMYPELFLYFSGAMCALGASALLATKVLLILINFLTAYCGYYGAKQILGDEGGMIFTILYLCCPYRLNDIYVRAALGEALAMAFLPLAAAGIYQLMQGDYKKGFWTALLGITGVLQSHIIASFLLVFFGALYGMVVLLWQGRRFWADRCRPLTLLAAAAATIVVNLWFLVPFLYFSRFDLSVFHEEGVLWETRVHPWQMFMESYTAGYTQYGVATRGQMPAAVGAALLTAIVLMLYRWLRAPRGTGTQETKQEKGLMALGTAALFMASTLFPWDRLVQLPIVEKTFSKIQFSWRLIMVAAVLYCMAAAAEIVLLRKEQKQIATGIVFALAFVSALNAGSQYFFTNDAYMLDKTSERDRDMSGGQYVLWQYKINDMQAMAAQGVHPLTEGAQATNLERELSDLTFDFVNQNKTEDAVFLVPQYDDTLHRASLADGQALAAAADGWTGLMQVTVPAGITEGTVRVYYHEPLPFRLATGVSVLAAAALALLWYRKHRRPAVRGAQ